MAETGLVIDDGDVIGPLRHQLQLQALHRLPDELRIQAVADGGLDTEIIFRSE